MSRSAADSLGPIRFSDLRAHVRRDAVIVVAPALELLTVAEAVARDDKAAVASWLAEGLLGKPTAEDVARWETTTEDVGLSVVVQPFVLFQERFD